MELTNKTKKYKWKNSYNTSICTVDEQNKKFIEIINKLSVSINENCNKEIFAEVFFSLIHYEEETFTKEKLFFKDNTEKFLVVQNSQEKLVEKIIQFQKKFEKQGNVNNSSAILEFLISWFENHIKIYDHQTIAFLKGKGVK